MKKSHIYTGQDVTIIICAYKECTYLEECILSVLKQSIPVKVLISTSTPNPYIMHLADKYGLSIRVNEEGGHVKDYNFAIEQADTSLVMLMHQDDLLNKDYVKECLFFLNRAKDPIMVCTDYLEMHNDIVDCHPGKMVRIKRVLAIPLRIPGIRGTFVGKWLAQCIGNPITHPTVMCVKEKLPKEVFRQSYIAAMDWGLWERLIRRKGSILFVGKVLLYHRMNKENITNSLIKETDTRYKEELKILRRFWPLPIAKFIMHFYRKAKKYY